MGRSLCLVAVLGLVLSFAGFAAEESPEAILARRPSGPLYDSGDTVMLLDYGRSEVQTDGSSVFRGWQLIWVRTSAGVAAWNRQEIP